jgi:hypothetical protein
VFTLHGTIQVSALEELVGHCCLILSDGGDSSPRIVARGDVDRSSAGVHPSTVKLEPFWNRDGVFLEP